MMEAYRPLLTKVELKDVCEDAREEIATPLAQARSVVRQIGRLRKCKPKKYGPGEWADEPHNQRYVEIAKEYEQARHRKYKARKEARKQDLL